VPDTWCIYHVENCSHTIPKPKNKFVAVVCRDSNYRGFLINTDIDPYILEQPILLMCQITIKVSDYKFLDHNSHINCVDLFPFEDNELALSNFRCNINIMTKAEIQKAVKDSGLIEGRWEKLILSGS